MWETGAKLYCVSPGEGLVIPNRILMVAEQVLFWTMSIGSPKSSPSCGDFLPRGMHGPRANARLWAEGFHMPYRAWESENMNKTPHPRDMEMSLAKHGANPRKLASVGGTLWGSNQGKGGVQGCAAPVGSAGRTSGSNWAFSQGTEMSLPLYPGQGCPDTTHPFWLPSSLRRAEPIPAAGEEQST